MINNASSVIESADIVSTIQKFVELKRSGTNYTGHSPFNPDDKTPSFVVSPRKQIYKCFSTGKGGDVVSFLMEYKRWTFVEAVEYLAADTNVIIEYSQGANREVEMAKEKENKEIRKHLYDVMLKVHDSYCPPTPENDGGLVTIAGKSYTPDVVVKWGLRTAGDFGHLANLSKSWPMEDRSAIIDMGIIKANKKADAHYDFFHHRLLFPLVDDRGHLVGYNGRITEHYPAPAPDPKGGEKKAPPKYINSPETLIYHKGKHLYGYYQNEAEIERMKLALLVEGPTDVIGLDMAGIGYAVCSSGTAFTADQAKILSRSADTVIICFDGDKAGGDAAIRAITVLLRVQMEVKVKVMPEGDDPASYVAQHGAEAFTALPSTDAIEYAIDTNFPNLKDATPTVQSGALLLAVGLIAEIGEQSIRDAYCMTLYKQLNVTRKVLSDLVEEKIAQKEDATSKLTPEQEQMKMTYGLYTDNNSYINHTGTRLSNFIIKPLFLVRGRDLSRRVFEISNIYGHRDVIQMVTDDFILMSGFKKKVESLGNYLLEAPCKEEHYIKIKAVIYKEMETVVPIDVLGYHKGGFYAFSNGVINQDGKYVPVDEYGIVPVKVGDRDVKFYLPTFSIIDKADDMNDGENNTFDNYFVYRESPSVSITLPNVIDTFNKLFGINAVIALSYYMASLYRDFIFGRMSNTFPILNLFGPPGSGKTFMARALVSFFGSPNDMKPLNCVNSSVSAYTRRIAQGKNSLAHFDEYGFEVTPEKVQVLKDFYDAGGRTLSDKNNRDKISQSVVRAACVLTGQILPSHDPALMERVVNIYTAVVKVTGEQKRFAQEYEDRAAMGYYTQVTAELAGYRDVVIKRYDAKFAEVTDMIRTMFGTDQPKYRFIANYSMIATTLFIIGDILRDKYNYTLPWKNSEIYDTIYDRIREQVVTVEDMDEVSAFFKMVEFLIFNNILKNDMYACEEGVTELRVENEYDIRTNMDKSLETAHWYALRNSGREPSVLFLNMSFTHQLYKLHSKQSGDLRVLQESTLKNYLKVHPSYLGKIRGKKVGGKTVRVWCFDTTKLDKFSFIPTLYTQKSTTGGDENTTEGEKIQPTEYDPQAKMTFNNEKPPF
jgi:DNA primase